MSSYSKKSKFTEVYTTYYSVVFGSIYTRLGNTTVAEDLTQEVFMRYLNDMDKVRNVRPWLITVLKRVLYEHYRQKKKLSEEQAISEAYDDVALTFVNGFRDTRIIITEAIESIQEETDQIIFDLIAVQNFSYEQVGDQLGFSKRKVRYRYNLIVKQITDFLQKKGVKNIEDLL